MYGENFSVFHFSLEFRHFLNADTATSTIVRISLEQHMQVATKLVMKARVFKYAHPGVCKVFFPYTYTKTRAGALRKDAPT
jgi:hypothetical protein